MGKSLQSTLEIPYRALWKFPTEHFEKSPMDPEARLLVHNAGGCSATREGRPWSIGATIGDFPSKKVALAFESQLQGQRAQPGLRAKVQHAIALAALCRI